MYFYIPTTELISFSMNINQSSSDWNILLITLRIKTFKTFNYTSFYRLCCQHWNKSSDMEKNRIKSMKLICKYIRNFKCMQLKMSLSYLFYKNRQFFISFMFIFFWISFLRKINTFKICCCFFCCSVCCVWRIPFYIRKFMGRPLHIL